MTDIRFNLSEIEKKIATFINENSKQIARQIATDAKSSVNSVTGNLKRSIKARKSKFEDGGYIVIARAPHAHLVEYGHGGPRPAPAHPFLRPALDKNINAARASFGAR